MSEETHLPPIGLPNGVGTFARWSKKPTGKLLVFVHGFHGSATETWAGFPNQICLHTEADGYDLVSFGYKSVKQDAGHSANQLHVFLNELLFKKPHLLVNKSLADLFPEQNRKNEFKYEKVVMVGHSLGACVIRRAFLNEIKGGTGSWPKDCRLIWFAPAHRGARALRLLTAVTLGVRGGLSFSTASTYFSPVLADLKEDSRFLKELLIDTEKHNAVYPQLNSPLTFWADNDRVVVDGEFANDKAPFEEIPGTGHISLCKPAGYDRRTQLLLEQL